MPLEMAFAVIAWGLGILFGLIAVIGGLCTYVFIDHKRDNDRRFQENREDHVRIHDRLDDINDNG